MSSSKIPCRISTCLNGYVHISLGNVTMHLSDNDFLELAKMVSTVESQLKQPTNVSYLRKFQDRSSTRS